MQRKCTTVRAVCPGCKNTFTFSLKDRRKFCSGVCYKKWKAADTTVDRFWAAVNKTETCWLWTGNTNNKGYGLISPTGKFTRLAHRVSWKIHFGTIPDNMEVCHHCDVRSCVRPDHLFLGTQAINMADMYRKNRHPKGEDRGHAKLTTAAVRQMRELYLLGAHQDYLAERFGVSQGTVSNVVNRRTWTHV